MGLYGQGTVEEPPHTHTHAHTHRHCSKTHSTGKHIKISAFRNATGTGAPSPHRTAPERQHEDAFGVLRKRGGVPQGGATQDRFSAMARPRAAAARGVAGATAAHCARWAQPAQPCAFSRGVTDNSDGMSTSCGRLGMRSVAPTPVRVCPL